MKMNETEEIMTKASVIDKKSFVLYLDFLDTLDHLSDKQAGIVFKAIYVWQQTGQLPPLDLAMKLVLAPLVAQFKRDNVKWDDICAKRSVSGKKGAKQKLANAGKRKQRVANLAVSGSESVNVSDSESVNENAKNTNSGRFKKPSYDELNSYIQSYSEEKGKQQIDASAFLDFYDSKGWRVGNTPMKDWRAAVRTWFKKQSPTNQPTNPEAL